MHIVCLRICIAFDATWLVLVAFHTGWGRIWVAKPAHPDL